MFPQNTIRAILSPTSLGLYKFYCYNKEFHYYRRYALFSLAPQSPSLIRGIFYFVRQSQAPTKETANARYSLSQSLVVKV